MHYRRWFVVCVIEVQVVSDRHLVIFELVHSAGVQQSLWTLARLDWQGK